MGVILAAQGRSPRTSGPRSDHRPYDDHAHLKHQRRSSEDLVSEERRRLPRLLLRNGLRGHTGVRGGQLHWTVTVVHERQTKEFQIQKEGQGRWPTFLFEERKKGAENYEA